MGYLFSCYKYNNIFLKFMKQIRTVNSLAHSEEQLNNKKNLSIKIDKKTITKLERISLVNFDNEVGIRRLEAAILFAQKLKEVPLDSKIKPMYSVLDNEQLELRDDKVIDGNYRDKILKNTTVVDDEYFVAPPGNIPKI